MSKKKIEKKEKITPIDKVVKTKKVQKQPEPVSNESEGVKEKPKETKKPKNVEPKRKPRKDKGKKREVPILGTENAPPVEKQNWSTGVKVGFTLGMVTVFAVAFYAMYRALEKYRKEKKEIQDADEFLEKEQESEKFVEESKETDNTE